MFGSSDGTTVLLSSFLFFLQTSNQHFPLSENHDGNKEKVINLPDNPLHMSPELECVCTMGVSEGTSPYIIWHIHLSAHSKNSLRWWLSQLVFPQLIMNCPSTPRSVLYSGKFNIYGSLRAVQFLSFLSWWRSCEIAQSSRTKMNRQANILCVLLSMVGQNTLFVAVPYFFGQSQNVSVVILGLGRAVMTYVSYHPQIIWLRPGFRMWRWRGWWWRYWRERLPSQRPQLETTCQHLSGDCGTISSRVSDTFWREVRTSRALFAVPIPGVVNETLGRL